MNWTGLGQHRNKKRDQSVCECEGKKLQETRLDWGTGAAEKAILKKKE